MRVILGRRMQSLGLLLLFNDDRCDMNVTQFVIISSKADILRQKFNSPKVSIIKNTVVVYFVAKKMMMFVVCNKQAHV